MEAAEKISSGVIKEKQKVKQSKKAEIVRVSQRKSLLQVGDIRPNLVWTTVASFLTIYCTDVAGIAAGVVEFLMLIT